MFRSSRLERSPPPHEDKPRRGGDEAYRDEDRSVSLQCIFLSASFPLLADEQQLNRPFVVDMCI